MKGLRGTRDLLWTKVLPASDDNMLVEKILARPFENLDAPSARRLMEELDEVQWALTTVQSLADDDKGGALSERFAKWRGLVDERRACMATLYLDAPSTAQEG